MYEVIVKVKVKGQAHSNGDAVFAEGFCSDELVHAMDREVARVYTCMSICACCCMVAGKEAINGQTHK